ncbi:TIGR03621 family F420-dependent LLM class oxidoreductase [Streptomyces sp. NPDC026589]|uniref:TIGR03621 family F420-dependent LLM class oxidoreductase n=1 Tax=Streptomyces sp. NPDC026589 TaxID=3155609 RepID=UPI0033F11E48
MSLPFRFGVSLPFMTSRDEWIAKCRRAEELGYDVILIPDHLGMPAPFPSLLLAAEVTERPRVGTFVLNSGFHNPTLLAREAFTTDLLTGGRLELGFGAGYDPDEVKQAELPWQPPGRRVDHLEHVVRTVRRLATDDSVRPRPTQPLGPPLMVAGSGDRVMRFAARHADTVAFSGVKPAPTGVDNPHVVGDTPSPYTLAEAEAVDERVRFVRAAAEGREKAPEFNVIVQNVAVTRDRRGTAEKLREAGPDLSVDQLLEVPTLLIGTVEEMAEQLRAHRERFGFSYITVVEPFMDDFAGVIEKLH